MPCMNPNQKTSGFNGTVFYTPVEEEKQRENWTPSQGAFHFSEPTGQDIPIVMRILLLIKAIQPDQSNPKQYVRRKSSFIKNSWIKPILFSKWLVRAASSDFQKAPLVTIFIFTELNFNSFNPKIKIKILLCHPYSFTIEVVGRS